MQQNILLKLSPSEAIDPEAIKRHIASETGKKLPAIGLSLIYKKEWPLIIICPYVMRHSWIDEFKKWIP